MYVNWSAAVKKGNTDEADYFKGKMSEEFAKLLDSEQGAETDRAVHEYDSLQAAEVLRLQAVITEALEGMGKAKEQQQEADKFNGYGDAFTFVTVLFTIVLFFGGMAAVSKKLKLKTIYVAAALLVFLYSVVNMFLTPIP